MRQKRGRGCPGKCRSIVAFPKRTGPVPALRMDSPVGASYFPFFALFTLPSVKGLGAGTDRAELDWKEQP